jgi:two-component system sensor histidine kinase UhpB
MKSEAGRFSHGLRLRNEGWMNTMEFDRLSIARDLHDTVVQDFIVMIMQLRRAAAIDNSADQRRQTLACVSAAEEGLSRVRLLLAKLRGRIDDEGARIPEQSRSGFFYQDLHLALEHRFMCSDIEFDIDCPFTLIVPPGICSEILHIVGEAASNAVRHSKAKLFKCAVCQNDQVVRVEVQDNGIGFTENRRTRGFGLLGMRERALLIGANLTIDARPKRGVVIRLAVRLPDPYSEGLRHAQVSSEFLRPSLELST